MSVLSEADEATATNYALMNSHDRRVINRIANNWKLTPATFAYQISRGTWIPSPHLMYISSRVAKAVANGNGRIIISAPPRHGKSQLTSIYTPAWVLEMFPQYKTILAGYGAELATGFSRQVRDIYFDADNKDLLTTRVRKDSSRVEAFLTEQGGGMYAVSVVLLPVAVLMFCLSMTTSRRLRRRSLLLTAIISGIGLLPLRLPALSPTEHVSLLLLAGILTISLAVFSRTSRDSGNTSNSQQSQNPTTFLEETSVKHYFRNGIPLTSYSSSKKRSEPSSSKPSTSKSQ